MANDFGAMQNRIANEMRGIAASSASRIQGEIQNAIQTAIKFYERRRFYFNEKFTGTFSTVNAQEYYTTAALTDIPNIIVIDAVKLTTAGGVFQSLAPRSFTDMDAQQDGSQSGDPTYFAYYGQQIRLYPKPNAVRTITMAYVFRLSALTVAADTNAWMTDGEELIRQRAKRIIAMDVLGVDDMSDKLAARAATMEKEALDALLAESVQRASYERLLVDPRRTTTPTAMSQIPGG